MGDGFYYLLSPLQDFYLCISDIYLVAVDMDPSIHKEIKQAAKSGTVVTFSRPPKKLWLITCPCSFTNSTPEAEGIVLTIASGALPAVALRVRSPTPASMIEASSSVAGGFSSAP